MYLHLRINLNIYSSNMEQAVNTFTRGLQLDTNPMIQGNDSLTDCLNGTIVTMNGNEMILQNDMGNRRVDNVFLPSGYQPVGIKEYGGVIYVAAYNPITNKSQIGSFPSPQKRINSLNTIGMGGIFDFDKFFYNNNVTQDSDLFNIKVINSDSFMIPLTKDVSLRAGDKFVIYSNDISKLKNNISNYDNTINDENGVKYIKSPKNKKYTLQLGILNSQNEFVDITKTLCRWEYKNEKSVPKIYNQSYSDLYKFNDGYFIAQSFDNDNLEYTEGDSNVIINRQTLPANTYSYKLIGPLYLKVILNHIQNFNYNIYGYKEENNTLLTIEGFITYNCPDGVNFEKNPVGEYYTLDEGEVNFQSFNLYNANFEKIGISEEKEKYKCEYLPETNQYRVKVVKHYKIDYTNGIFNYVIAVNADTTQDNDIYIKELSSKGSLNLDLLGTGTLKYNGWKFYNNQEETTLTFSFEAYPKYGENFSDLQFEFEDITNSNNKFYFPLEGTLPVYNGRQTYIFNWKTIGLESRKVYKVITHYKSGNDKKLKDKELNDNRWLLTTSLFNDFYPSSSKISDFCTTEDKNFKNKMDVSLEVEDDLKTNFPEKTSFSGALAGKNQTISYSCKHTIGINVISNPTLKIVNEELYPDFITINDSYKNSVRIVNPISIKIGNKITDKDSLIKDFKEQLSVVKNGTIKPETEQKFDNFNIIEYENLSINSNIITGEINYYDLYESDGDSGFQINNAFGKVEDLIQKAVPKEGYYGGIYITYENRSGHRDNHFIDVYHLQKSKMISSKIEKSINLQEGGTRAWSENSDSTQIVPFEDISSFVFEHFNRGLQEGQMFMFIFPTKRIWFDNQRDSIEATTEGFSSNPLNGFNYTRVWWRTSNPDSWALFPWMLKNYFNQDDIINQIKNIFKNKVYCMYNNYTVNENLYAATGKNIYYGEYSIPLTLLIKYILSADVNDILNIKNKFGNLTFSKNSTINEHNSILINLNSSETFHNNILSFNRNSIYSVDLNTGLMYDSLGRNLDPNYIYINDSGQLVRVNNTYMQVDFDNKIENMNTLVYNRNTLGAPLYRYDHTGENDDTYTVIDYNSVNIVRDI